MNITLFKEITTEDALKTLEADGLKYKNLYVDMDNPDERRYVKENAALINGLLKKLDRARIDKTKAYKQSVEAEAADIKARLQEANKPFTLLIDQHTEKRAKILAEKKAREDAKALAIQIESDHEIGLLLNDKHDKDAQEAAEAARIAQEEHDERIAKEAREQAEKSAQLQIERAERKAKEAIKREQDRVEREKAAAKADQERRERDTEHKGSVNREALAALVKHSGITEQQGKDAIAAIITGKIPSVTISY